MSLRFVSVLILRSYIIGNLARALAFFEFLCYGVARLKVRFVLWYHFVSALILRSYILATLLGHLDFLHLFAIELRV